MGVKMPSDASPQLRTAYSWLTGLSTWDFPSIAKTLSDKNYQQQLHPLSIGRPPVAKQEWLTHMENNAKPMFKEWSFDLLEAIEAPGKVVFHVTANGLSASDLPYKNEFMIILTLEDHESGEPKICGVKEFVDSASAKAFFTKERELQAEAAKKKSEGQ